MTYHLYPIPMDDENRHLWDWRQHWMPFIPKIAQRSKDSIDHLIDLVRTHRVQVILILNDEGKSADALLGISTVKRGDDVIGEVVWATGKGMKDWVHLLPKLEEYLKYIGCVEIKPICRVGWARMLKQHGYRETHRVMEKRLT